MIYYRLLKRVNFTGVTVYYLCSKDFKYKKPKRVIDLIDLNMYAYKDFDSLLPVGKLGLLNEDLFDVLSYKEVEDFFTYIQRHISINKSISGSDLLKDLERILLYWDDYN